MVFSANQNKILLFFPFLIFNFSRSTLKPDEIKLLNLANSWVCSFLPHCLSKINRVSYGILSPEWVSKADPMSPLGKRERGKRRRERKKEDKVHSVYQKSIAFSLVSYHQTRCLRLIR